MSNFLRTVEFLCVGLWLGSDAFLSFVVAPGAFSVLARRDQAGAMVGYALGRMHFAGIFLGLLFLVVRWGRSGGTLAGFKSPAVLAVSLMVVLTLISQFTVSAKMALLRIQMGSIEATSVGSPLLEEFGKLHRISVFLEGGVLLAGFAAMYWLVRELASPR